MVEVKSISIDKDYSFDLTKPISFPDELMHKVELGVVSSNAIGLYCLCEEIKMLKQEIRALKNGMANTRE